MSHVLVAAATAATQPAVPPHIYTYWESPKLPELVASCLASMAAAASDAGWTLHVLSQSSAEVQAVLPDDATLGSWHIQDRWRGQTKDEQAHLTDFIRLAILHRYGGVWLDASVLLFDRPFHWLNTSSHALQAVEWSAFGPPGTIEDSAMAAPPGHELVGAWKQVYASALRRGLRAYCQSLDDELMGPECTEASVQRERERTGDFTSSAAKFCRSLRPFTPYLAAYAAYNEARRSV
eukprot:6354225-Prymnesium_polylepis.1